ncbi:MAG TPA: hypothetical protein VF574_17670 [Allosphingosinicella sp.]|jgi:hypothetical protein
MDNHDSRPAHPPEPASDDAASPPNAPPGKGHDLLGFEPVPLRYRTDGLTPEKQRAFVEALADCGLVREAAARIGVSEQCINRVRRRSDARDFDRACEAAQMFGARRLRSVAYERAIEGTLKGHYYHGERVGEERVYDNRLLTYLLGKTEHLLQPPKECRAICDDWEAHMEALEQGIEAPAIGCELLREGVESQVWEDEKTGTLLTTFPPPEGFDGEEEGVWDGIGWYCRTLTPAEQAAIEARDARDMAEARASECARRDRFFGFAGNEVSPLMEGEPSEPSEPSGEELGPIEYKSLVPPTPSFRRRPESMNTEVRNSAPPWSWLPDRVRHDGEGAASRPIPAAGFPLSRE